MSRLPPVAHRTGRIEHQHHIVMAKVALGVAIGLDRHGVVPEDMHQRGRNDRVGDADDLRIVVGIGVDLEVEVLRAQCAFGEIELEELLRFRLVRGGPLVAVHRLAAGQRRGVAGVLQFGLGHIGEAEIETAPDDDDQRDQCRSEDRQGIALRVVPEIAQHTDHIGSPLWDSR